MRWSVLELGYVAISGEGSSRILLVLDNIESGDLVRFKIIGELEVKSLFNFLSSTLMFH